MKYVESFLCSNSVGGRLLRTFFQLIMGAVAAVFTMDNIVLVVNEAIAKLPVDLGEPGAAVIMAVVVAVLSPIMAELGKWAEN